MASIKGVIIKCPFCGKEHEVKGFGNVMCYCEGRGKFYTMEGFWLGRKGEHEGKRVKLTGIEEKILFSFLLLHSL